MIKTGLFWRFEGTHYYTAQGESLEDYNFLSKKLLITKVVFQMPSSLLGRTTVLVCRHHSVCADITPCVQTSLRVCRHHSVCADITPCVQTSLRTTHILRAGIISATRTVTVTVKKTSFD